MDHDIPVTVPKVHSAKHRASKKVVLGGERQDTDIDTESVRSTDISASSSREPCKEAHTRITILFLGFRV